MPFTKATKTKARLRLALIGPSGSGKTYSALSIAKGFGGKLALIDTEHGSASKYADLFDFDTQELSSFSPEAYIAAIDEAAKAGYDVLVIDSLSHAWMGKDGILESVDRVTKASRSNNAYTTGWRDATPRHNALVEALVQSPLHLIVTMRAKTAYVMEVNDRGKSEPKKVGMEAIQRDGLEYEFDVVGDLTLDLDLHVSKSRCPGLTGSVINKPDASLALTLEAWLTDGADPVPLPAQAPRTAAPPAAQAQRPKQTAPSGGSWFERNGWKDKAVHDEWVESRSRAVELTRQNDGDIAEAIDEWMAKKGLKFSSAVKNPLAVEFDTFVTGLHAQPAPTSPASAPQEPSTAPPPEQAIHRAEYSGRVCDGCKTSITPTGGCECPF